MPEPPSDSLREVYERRAALQYAEPAALPDRSVDRKFDRMLQLVAETLPAESLLDAGCGDGRFLAGVAQLPNAPRELVGTDIADRILETAARWAARDGFEAHFVRANLEQLPFPDETFDRVVCIQVIEHLLDPAAGLAELARVLRPAGRLVLSTDSSENTVSRVLNAPRTTAVRVLGWRGRRAKVHFPHRDFPIAEIAGLIENANLRILHQETFRFHLDGINHPVVNRLLARADRALGPHNVGDIVAFVAGKPPV